MAKGLGGAGSPRRAFALALVLGTLCLTGCSDASASVEPEADVADVAADAAVDVTSDALSDAAAADVGAADVPMTDTPEVPVSPLLMEVGTGGSGAFRSFADGDTLLLQRGIQGAQHVYVSLRIRDAAEGPIDFSIEIRRTRDDVVVSIPYGYALRMERQLDERTWETTGLTPVVPVPDDILNEDVRIRVSITDTAGATLTVDRYANIVWGPDSASG